MKVVHEIPPVFDENSTVLVLGSFPSVKSREQGFFYGNAQNRFWRVLAAIFEEDIPQTVDEKKRFLLRNKVALFDVVKECEIVGSSDAKIKNAVPSDIEKILKAAPTSKIILNGRKAAELFEKNFSVDIPVVTLPSTSAANASVDFVTLVKKWSEAFENAT